MVVLGKEVGAAGMLTSKNHAPAKSFEKPGVQLDSVGTVML